MNEDLSQHFGDIRGVHKGQESLASNNSGNLILQLLTRQQKVIKALAKRIFLGCIEDYPYLLHVFLFENGVVRNETGGWLLYLQRLARLWRCATNTYFE